METSANSAGSALIENEKYLDSINGRISILKATWEDFSQSILGGDIVKGAVSGLTGLLDVFSKITNMFNSPALLGGGFLAFKEISKAVKGKGVWQQDSLGKVSINEESSVGKLANTYRQISGSFTQMRKDGKSIKTALTEAASTWWNGPAGVPNKSSEIDRSLKQYKLLNDEINSGKLSGVALENAKAQRERVKSYMDLNPVLKEYVERQDEAVKAQKEGNYTLQGAKKYADDEGKKLTTLGAKAKVASIGMQAANIAAGALQGALMGLAIQGATLLLGELHKFLFTTAEEMQTARAAADDYSSSMQTLGDYQNQLDAARAVYNDPSASLEERHAAYEQISSIQSELIGKYGAEAAGLNLLTSSAEEYAAAMNSIKANEANNLLYGGGNENLEGLEKAAENVYSVRTEFASLGAYDKEAFGADEVVKGLQGIADKYDEVAYDIDANGQMSLNITANADEGVEVINKVKSDVDNLIGDLSKRGIDASAVFSSLTSGTELFGRAYGNFSEVLERDGGAAEAYMQARIATSSDYTNAVDEIMSKEQSLKDVLGKSDEEFGGREEKYKAVKNAMEELSKLDVEKLIGQSWGKNTMIDDYITNMLGDAKEAMASYQFEYDLQASLSDNSKNNMVSNLRDSLKAAVSDMDIGTIKDLWDRYETDGFAGMSEKEKGAINAIKGAIDEYHISVESLLTSLKDVGAAQGEMSNVSYNAAEELSKATTQYEKASSAEALNSAIANLGKSNGMLDIDTYKTLISSSSDYARAIDYENGFITLNIQKAHELAKAKSDLAMQSISEQKANDSERYKQNLSELTELMSQEKSALTDRSRARISALQAENEAIASNIGMYNVYMSQLRQMSSAYTAWKGVTETNNSDTTSKDMVSAIKQMKDFRKKGQTGVGNVQYQMAVEMLVPDDVEVDDVGKYINNKLGRYFKENHPERGVQNWLSDMVETGWMTKDDDGNYKLIDTANLEQAAASLHITRDAMESLVGLANMYAQTEIKFNDPEDISNGMNLLNEYISRVQKLDEVSSSNGTAENIAKAQEQVSSVSAELASLPADTQLALGIKVVDEGGNQVEPSKITDEIIDSISKNEGKYTIKVEAEGAPELTRLLQSVEDNKNRKEKLPIDADPSDIEYYNRQIDQATEKANALAKQRFGFEVDMTSLDGLLGALSKVDNEGDKKLIEMYISMHGDEEVHAKLTKIREEIEQKENEKLTIEGDTSEIDGQIATLKAQETELSARFKVEGLDEAYTRAEELKQSIADAYNTRQSDQTFKLDTEEQFGELVALNEQIEKLGGDKLEIPVEWGWSEGGEQDATTFIQKVAADGVEVPIKFKAEQVAKALKDSIEGTEVVIGKDGSVEVKEPEHSAIGDALSKTAEDSIKSAESAKTALNEMDSLIARRNNSFAKLKELHVDPSQTIFGNIDLNDRGVIKWTEDKLNEYHDVLTEYAKWDLGEDASQKQIENYIGRFKDTVSTVFGGSEPFKIDGQPVEIAFSPMLQTGDGNAELLSPSVVENYIGQIIDMAMVDNEWSADELLKLDAAGIDMDGKHIQGLIADIGDTAIQTGEAMHYLGKDGALALLNEQIDNLDNIDPAAKKARELADSIKTAFEGSNKLQVDIQTATIGGKMQSAIDEIQERSKIKIQADVEDGSIKEKMDEVVSSIKGQQPEIQPTVNADSVVGGVQSAVSQASAGAVVNVGANTTEANTKIAAIKAIKNINLKAKVTADTKKAKSDINSIDRKKIKDKSFKVTANAGGALSIVNSISNAIKNLKDKTVNIGVRYTSSGDVKAAGGRLPMATGGTAAGGRTLVGELGPEMVVSHGRYYMVGQRGAEFVNLKHGDIVFNNTDTQMLLAGRSGVRGQALADGGIVTSGPAFSSGSINLTKALSASKTSKTSKKKRSSSSNKAARSLTSSANKATEDLDKKVEELAKELSKILENFDAAVDAELKKRGDLDNIIKTYKDAQAEIRKQQAKYRSMGIADNSKYINELESQWYEYKDKIGEAIQKIYEFPVREAENAANLNKNLMKQAIRADDISKAEVHLVRAMDALLEQQQLISEEATKLRAEGFSDNSEEVSELSLKWWDLQEDRLETQIDLYDAINERVEATSGLYQKLYETATEEGNRHNMEIAQSYILGSLQAQKNVIESQILAYRDLGYSDASKEIKELQTKWYEVSDAVDEARDKMIDALNDVVDKYSDAIDEIQDVYKTLHDAAEEYAKNGGYISVDSFQEIMKLGPKYMQYLEDENGLLTINDKNINKVIAAKTEEAAVESALTYLEQVKIALLSEDMDALNNLVSATTSATGGTWGLVYATASLLKNMGMSDGQYEDMMWNINSFRMLAESSINDLERLGENGGLTYEQMISKLKDSQDSIEDFIKYVMDMLEDRLEDQIDKLEEMEDEYKEIISLKKESLKASKEEDDYQKSIAEKVKEAAKLQGQIQILSLDDSREARAQRMKLEEQLAELQNDISDKQADYALDRQEEMLDDMSDAYSKAKEEEIEKLKETYSSKEKLYRAAVDYMSENPTTVYDEVIAWNYEQGSTLQYEIEETWIAAQNAVKEYGGTVKEVLDMIRIKIKELNEVTNGDGKNEHYDVVAKMRELDKEYTDEDSIRAILDMMEENSADWVNGEHVSSHASNKFLSNMLEKYGIISHYDDKTGEWYLDDGRRLYDVFGTGYASYASPGEVKVNEAVALEDIMQTAEAMRRNSAAWSTSKDKDALSKANEQMAKEMAKYGLILEKTKDGKWIIRSDQYNPETVGQAFFDTYMPDGSVKIGEKTIKSNTKLSGIKAAVEKATESSVSRVSKFASTIADSVADVLSESVAPNAARSLLAFDTGAFGSVTPTQEFNISFGDTYITGTAEENIRAHEQVTREFTNEVLKQLNIRR